MGLIDKMRDRLSQRRLDRQAEEWRRGGKVAYIHNRAAAGSLIHKRMERRMNELISGGSRPGPAADLAQIEVLTEVKKEQAIALARRKKDDIQNIKSGAKRFAGGVASRSRETGVAFKEAGQAFGYGAKVVGAHANDSVGTWAIRDKAGEGDYAKAQGKEFSFGSSMKSLFSKNVCPFCHAPTIEIKGRHFCSRPGCIYNVPRNCPWCGEILSLEGKEFKCSNNNCLSNKNDDEHKKFQEHMLDSGYAVRGERIEQIHKSRVLRTAIIMAAGAIPLIFPGGFAGICFMLSIWSLALEFFFPSEPRREFSMIFKSFGRLFAIILMGAGFYLLNFQFVSLFVLLIGYYSFPSGVGEHSVYKKYMGIYRTIFSIILAFLTLTSLGGPLFFRISLALFIFSFTFSLPLEEGDVGERIEGIVFFAVASAATFIGILALGGVGVQVAFVGFIIIFIGLLFYFIHSLEELREAGIREEEAKQKRAKEKVDEEWAKNNPQPNPNPPSSNP